jgi:two-component system, chemotaxis family, sensor kinase CheA
MVNINQQPLSTPVEVGAETQTEIPVRPQSATALPDCPINAPEALANIPEAVRMAAYASAQAGTSLHWLAYTPDEQCFFQGEDPFFQARHTPGLVWGGIVNREPWPKLAEMDAYRCVLDFHVLTAASQAELDEHYRYMADRITSQRLSPWSLIIPIGDPNGGPVYEDFVGDALDLLGANDLTGLERAAQTMLELSSPDLWFASALRWLLLVLEHEPDKPLLLATLIESLCSLEQPNWLGLQGQTSAAKPDGFRGAKPSATAAWKVLYRLQSPTGQSLTRPCRLCWTSSVKSYSYRSLSLGNKAGCGRQSHR